MFGVADVIGTVEVGHFIVGEGEVVFDFVHVGESDDHQEDKEDGNHEKVGVAHKEHENALDDNDGEGAFIEGGDIGRVALHSLLHCGEFAQAAGGVADGEQRHDDGQNSQDSAGDEHPAEHFLRLVGDVPGAEMKYEDNEDDSDGAEESNIG